MSFFEKLRNLFSAPSDGDKRSLWLYVQCDKCGEILSGRVDLYNDLSVQFEGGATTYFTRKVLIGSQRCYRPIELELTFDQNRKLIDQEIKGGEFVTKEAYLAAQSKGEG
ncbi:MAG: hypothetical protein ACK2T5_16840 [Anaerolineales bacterium]|jgi:hypothetical protein